MSKYVKNLISDHLREQFAEVNDALLVNMVGLDANANNVLRAELAEKGIEVLVVKNSLAARATEGTSLDGLFEDVTGTNAVCWGAEDVVSLAKEVVKLAKDARFEAFEPRGGIMDGERLSADWPHNSSAPAAPWRARSSRKPKKTATIPASDRRLRPLGVWPTLGGSFFLPRKRITEPNTEQDLITF